MSITSVKSGATGISLALDNNFMEPIATTLVGSGGVNQITFSDIPQNYKHLQIRGLGRTTTSNTDDNVYMQFNGDTSNNYAAHYLYGNGSSVTAAAATSQSNVVACRIPGASSTASIFGTSVVDILDYANSSKNKTVRTLTGHDQNGSGLMFLISGLWQSTLSITSITLYVSPNNIAQHSRFSLYGIKG